MSDTTVVSDAATAFFEDLARRGHEPLLEKTRGTVSIELTDGTGGGGAGRGKKSCRSFGRWRLARPSNYPPRSSPAS